MSLWSQKGLITCTTTRLKPLAVVSCLLAHVLVAVIIICLIVFIEKTIEQNHIRGAYTIRSTGQLIPFIIGVVSMLAIVKDILLEWLHDVSVPPLGPHALSSSRIAV